MEQNDLQRALMAVLFAAGEPVAASRLAESLPPIFHWAIRLYPGFWMAVFHRRWDQLSAEIPVGL